MQRLSDKQFDCPPYDGERTYYIICSSARTGSYLLCHLLTNCGVMGVPAEYFTFFSDAKFLIERLKLQNKVKINIPEYVEALKNLRTTPNGVFGMKMHYFNMKNFSIQR